METETKEKVKAKARRLLEMATRGTEHERPNAKQKLDDLIRKHNIPLSEIDISLNNRIFTIDNEDDKVILTNIILSINPYTTLITEKKFITTSLDDEDYAEVKSKFSYFVKLFRVEKELLTMAFFTKHADSFKPDEEAKKKFRDGSKSMNRDFQAAKNDAENIQKQAEAQFKAQPPSKDFPDSEKDMEIQEIRIRNLTRLNRMAEIMLDTKYKKANRSLENEKK